MASYCDETVHSFAAQGLHAAQVPHAAQHAAGRQAVVSCQLQLNQLITGGTASCHGSPQNIGCLPEHGSDVPVQPAEAAERIANGRQLALQALSGRVECGTEGYLRCELDTLDVCFAHDSISSKFRNGSSLDETINLIRCRKIPYDVLPDIDACWHDGFLFAVRGNRRLFVARVLAAVGGRPFTAVRIHLQDSALAKDWKKWAQAYTSKNYGSYIQVRSSYAERLRQRPNRSQWAACVASTGGAADPEDLDAEEPTPEDLARQFRSRTTMRPEQSHDFQFRKQNALAAVRRRPQDRKLLSADLRTDVDIKREASAAAGNAAAPSKHWKKALPQRQSKGYPAPLPAGRV